MIDWMSTASIEICEDLIDSAILKIWAKSREGIMIHLQNDTVTPTSRFRSKELFQEAGREMQQHMPQTMLTLCTHQIFVELDYQIDQTGPIRDSLGVWIERICKIAVEPTVRRRISASPELTIVRSGILRFYLACNQQVLPKLEDFIPEKESQREKLQDNGNGKSKFLGVGKNEELREQEKKDLKFYLRNLLVINNRTNVHEVEAINFKRGYFKCEYHSEEYKRVRSRCSTHAAVIFEEENLTYYGTIKKFFLVTFRDVVYRLAYMTFHEDSGTTPFNIPKIDLNSTFEKNYFVSLENLDRRVIFVPSADSTHVLEVPFHYSKSSMKI